MHGGGAGNREPGMRWSGIAGGIALPTIGRRINETAFAVTGLRVSAYHQLAGPVVHLMFFVA